MHLSLRHALVLSVSALALTCAPIAMSGLPFAPDMAAFAGNGNGNGGGNGGGGDGGNSGGGGGNSGGGSDSGGGGNSDHGNSGGNGNGGGNGSAKSSDNAGVSAGSSGNGRSKKSSDSIETADTEDSPSSKRSLNAELAGLNSLKRNINGLMNSSDPRMEKIREFIVASAELPAAEDEFEAASLAYLKATNDYLDLLTGLGLPSDTSVTPTSLKEQIDAIPAPVDDPLTLDIDESTIPSPEKLALEAALDDINDSGLWTALVDASDLAEAEAEELAEAQEASGPAALENALESAANRNREVTDEVVAWASEQLGVGEADGLIDDYIARQ